MLKTLLICVLQTCLLCLSAHAVAIKTPQKDPLVFDDRPLVDEEVQLPEWFSLSFLDLKDSLNDAKEAGKKGLIIYFGRKHCPYCQAHMKNNWGNKEIADYTQKYFNVIAIDVTGQKSVTDFDGKTYTEKTFSSRYKTNFTPSFLFFDTSQKLSLNLPGYRAPYQFRAALEYVADQLYLKESFSKYMSRAEKAMSYGQDELNENDAFAQPPYNLDRSRFHSSQATVVFFESPNCHACDVLHGGPMNEPEIALLLQNLDAIQLNTQESTPLITPGGLKTTSKKWAQKLQLSFAPSLLFFDEHGKEIVRVESIIQLFRLKYLLMYVQTKGYKDFATFQLWKEHLFIK